MRLRKDKPQMNADTEGQFLQEITEVTERKTSPSSSAFICVHLRLISRLNFSFRIDLIPRLLDRFWRQQRRAF
jgi:hypothetical protein